MKKHRGRAGIAGLTAIDILTADRPELAAVIDQYRASRRALTRHTRVDDGTMFCAGLRTGLEHALTALGVDIVALNATLDREAVVA